MPDWLSMVLRTAGLRLAVLPVSATMMLTASGLTMHFAGTAAFGMILLIGQLRMALPFADLGLGAAVSRAVARAGMSRTEAISAARLTRRTARVLVVVGVVGSFVALAAGRMGLWSRLITDPPSGLSALDEVVTASLVLFFVFLPLSLAERVMVGRDRSDRLVLLGLIPGAVNLAFVGLVGLAGVDPVWMALGLPLGKAVSLMICRRLADYPAEPAPPAAEQPAEQPADRPCDPPLAEVLRGGLPVLLATAGMVLLEQHGRFVLAAAGTAESLSVYALALQLYMPVHSVMYMAGKAFWPRFAVDLDPRLWRRANLTMVALGAAAAGGYAIFAGPLSALVSSGEMRLPGALTLTMAVLLVAQAAHLTQTNLLTDRAGFRRQALMSGVALLCAVPLTALGVRHGLGPLAPPTAMLAAVVGLQVVPGLVFAARRVRQAAETPEAPEPAESAGIAADTAVDAVADSAPDHSSTSTRSTL